VFLSLEFARPLNTFFGEWREVHYEAFTKKRRKREGKRVLGRAGKRREREKGFVFSFEIYSNKFNLNSNSENLNFN